MIQSFKDLIVWQKSIELVRRVYLISNNFPDSEKFTLTSQIRRAAISIPSNIAEGSRRGTKKDYIQFLRIASGSTAELETQFIIAKEIYSDIDFTHGLDLLVEINKMLSVLIKKLSSNTKT